MKSINYILLFSIFLSAQVFGQSVSYKLEKDSPLPFLKVHVDLLVCDLWSTNFVNTGSGIRADLFLNKRFSLYGGIKRAIFLDGIEADSDVFLPSKGLKTFGYTEINGYFHFKSKSEKKSIPIEISRSSNGDGRTSTVKYVTVQATSHRFLSLKGGLHNFSTSVPLRGFNIVSGDLVKHATLFSSLSDTNTINNAATNQRSTFGSIGISRKVVQNIVANSSKYGKLRSKIVSEIYFDIFLGMSTKFDDVVQDGRTYSPAFEAVKKGGWRIGWRKSWGLASMNMEFGSRPGIKGKGEDQLLSARTYMLIGVGFSLGTSFGKTGLKS